MSRSWVRSLYAQVLAGVALGILLGVLKPEWAIALRPLGDAFIKLIRMLIAPIVFGTVSVGIARMGHARDVGRVAGKAFLYFEVLSTVALIIGLVVAHFDQPGAGIHATAASIDASSISEYTTHVASKGGAVGFLLDVIPTTFVDAFAKGDILQVLLIAVFVGLAMLYLGEPAAPVVDLLDRMVAVLFRVVGLVMRFAPLGACGAMAFTIGKFGAFTLVSLARLMAGVYITCLLFIFVVLGAVARVSGFSLWRFLRYIREELLIVLGTSSSESVLPRMMEKLEAAGCRKSIVGFVVPTGYSFNLDGTSIYMTMAALFVAQAMDVKLTAWDTATMLAVLLLTSKGAAAVTGAGFITLAATLSSIHTVPVEGLALLLGVDRFMSEARALTNLVGNGVATIAIARWDGALDRERLRETLERTPPPAVTGP